MTVLVTGGCKNGKSSYAQEIACGLAKKSKSSPLYFATMIPHDIEDEERIRLHQMDRAGLGFKTVEVGKNLEAIVENLEAGQVILFDSLTAILANELFEGRRDFSPATMEKEAINITKKLENTLYSLVKKSDSIVFVSDEIYRDGTYDQITEIYRKSLARIQYFIAEKSDKIFEMLAGSPKDYKNIGIKSMEENQSSENKTLSEEKVLIIGGAYQGKKDFAKKHFSLSDSEIFVCSPDSPPDFSYPCLAHFENYIAWCLKNNISPRINFFDSNENERKGLRVIICDDIFCGVVPMDSFQRQLREATGRALQKISEKARLYRVFCGRGVLWNSF